MRTVASIMIVVSICSTALCQQSPVQSVSTDRLGTWAPHEANSCDTIYGDGRQLCLADRWQMHRQQQSEDQQAALQRAQAENLRLHNELLRKELARAESSPATPSTADLAAIPGFASWQTENRWFGADQPRTEYALLYAKDLHQQQPELAGRQFLNALSMRVRQVFAVPPR